MKQNSPHPERTRLEIETPVVTVPLTLILLLSYIEQTATVSNTATS